jgi:hypothetical protein
LRSGQEHRAAARSCGWISFFILRSNSSSAT